MGLHPHFGQLHELGFKRKDNEGNIVVGANEWWEDDGKEFHGVIESNEISNDVITAIRESFAEEQDDSLKEKLVLCIHARISQKLLLGFELHNRSMYNNLHNIHTAFNERQRVF